jgi:hypothetical protein
MKGTRFLSINSWTAYFLIFVLISAISTAVSTNHALASDSVCAEVKIEIAQELTLERQAFDAHMRINNGLSNITLENVDIDVSFSDESGNVVHASFDPNDTSALFFIKVDSVDKISDINGSGQVAPSTSADIHWLIIPASGASKGISQGTLYYVGATLKYTIGGEAHTTEVTPDYIFVKPMPELVLDYFLPSEVFGDDAFTDEIESPVPFTLGVRIANSGQGTAKQVKINSAQPKITENKQGLLIGFAIDGCEVNDVPAKNTLLATFGDIAPNKASIARWIMHCTLSGKFVEFKADFSHSDELGGELTSLIDSVHTHFLVKDVLVDVAGRDSIKDFLVKDGVVYRVYESENTEAQAMDKSSSSTLSASGNHYTLTTSVTAGFIYVKLTDPYSGQKTITEAVRSDGKYINLQNVWLSKERNGEKWLYYLNLFDSDSTGSYQISFEDAAQGNHAPVLQFIPDKSVLAENQLSFLVESTDPEGTIPVLTAESLPAMASFIDNGNGSGIFKWTPATAQAGKYKITFSASDGLLKTSQSMNIQVRTSEDTDGDGLPDAWEMKYFGTLDRDGAGDYDGDGISDMDEYLLGADPTQGNRAPSVPAILSPPDKSETTSLQPQLMINNSIDSDGDTVTYTFEVYSDRGMTTSIAGQSGVAAGSGNTSWTVPVTLADNTTYYWRVRATDGKAFSLWTYGSFITNTVNDAPGPFSISYPINGFEVGSLTPRLEITKSIDPDNDTLFYVFYVYNDSAMTNLATASPVIPEGDTAIVSWTVGTPLFNNTHYYWKAVATDEHGLSTSSQSALFLVNTSNAEPGTPSIISPAAGSEIASTEVDLTIDNSTDANGDTLTYFFELDKTPTFDSTSKITSGELNEEIDFTSWHVSGLQDNQLYYWRVKANDGYEESNWATGSFFVNKANNQPSVPTIRNPGAGAWTYTLTPELRLNPSTDVDNDALSYRFQVYSDSSMNNLVEQGETDGLNWTVPSMLSDRVRYYWRAQAVDEHLSASAWTELNDFFVYNNGANDPPSIKVIEPSKDILLKGNTLTIKWEDDDPDNNADIGLFYDTNNSSEDGLLITSQLKENPDGSGDFYMWNTSDVPDGTYYIYAVISDGVTPSVSYSQGAVTIDRHAPSITAVPSAGIYSSAKSVTLSTNKTADIYYTLDGSIPSINSILYTGPIEISSSMTVKAIAVDQAGNTSSVAQFIYTIDTAAPLITATPPAGTYTSAQTVTLSASEPSDIYYALDGSDPSTNSTLYSGPISIANSATIKAIAVDTAGNSSAVFSASYVIQQKIAVKVSTSLGRVLSGIKVYAFTASGSYTGKSATTDAEGNALFEPGNFSSGNYKFRADYLGIQFWSGAVSLPQTMNVDVLITESQTNVTIKTGAGPVSGAKVYLYSSTGTYLGVYAITDANGVVTFNLPAGQSFKFRADIVGGQYWTDPVAIIAGQTNEAVLNSGGGIFGVTLQKAADNPLKEIKVYLYNSTGASLGQNGITNDAGFVSFVVPAASYKLRADYMGGQFWSDVIPVLQGTTIPFTIPHKQTGITITKHFQTTDDPLQGTKVYLYTQSGTCVNLNGTTDAKGLVTFELPEISYKARADYMGQQYWSDALIWTDQTIAIPMADAEVTVSGAGLPKSNIKVYVFSSTGSSLGVNGATDQYGKVTFRIPAGTYKFRADYLSEQFWSDLVVLAPDVSNSVNISTGGGSFTVSAATDEVDPITGARCYAYTSTGSYTGLSGTTDASGNLSFSLANGSYKFRLDYLGKQYWSSVVTVPAVLTTQVIVPDEEVQVSVMFAGAAAPGIKVYLYSDAGSYLGQYRTTDQYGEALFDLPVGSAFKFRAYILGNQYMSDLVTVASGGMNEASLNAGGGHINVTVQKSAGNPLEAIKVYLLSAADSYLGQSATTDATGSAQFSVPAGTYKIRADYLGYQFKSADAEVNSDQSVLIEIPCATPKVVVNGLYQGAATAISGINTYLFTPEGTNLGKSAKTDSTGAVSFELPDKPYSVRADYMGKQYWSAPFTWTNTEIDIPMAEAQISVTGAGLPKLGLNVYAYSASGTYLGLVQSTSAGGTVTFRLPAGAYKFRADYLSNHYWTDEQSLIADTLYAVNISVGGGSFTLNALDGASGPIAGMKSYVFNSLGSYLGLSGSTDLTGNVSFDLPDGNYKIRMDYLGYQFWSSQFSVPSVMTLTENIAHQQVKLSVLGDLSGVMTPVQNVPIYLFNPSGSYLGKSQTTNSSGEAFFNLPQKDYKARADYLGDQFWSGNFSWQDAAITIAEGTAAVHVYKSSGDVAGCKVYLFSDTGSYLGQYRTTDSSGMASFVLPGNKEFKFRADVGGVQYMSEVYAITAGVTTNVDMNLN